MQPSRYRILIYSITLLALIVLAGIWTHKTVQLEIDQKAESISTYAFTVGQLLREAGVHLAPGDKLDPAAETWLKEGDRVEVQRGIQATILADGQIHRILTTERAPARILSEAGLSLNPGDLLLSDGSPVNLVDRLPPQTHLHLQIIRAAAFDLQGGPKPQTVTATTATIGQALWQAGVRLHAADALSASVETGLLAWSKTGKIQNKATLSISPSKDITIQAGSEEMHLRTSAHTVGEALAGNGLALQGLDYSQPAESDPLPEDGRIRLVRVREEFLVESVPIPFESELQPNNDLELDTQEIIQTGEYGLAMQRVRVRYEDGQEVSRKLEDKWTARPPRNRIVGYGTKIVMHTLDTPAGPIQYWRALKMWATSYHPANTGNITATGMQLKKGIAAIDTNYIPFYTRMYVPGYGEALAADRGGGVKGRWIDLGYSDSDYQSWHQWVTVYFLWPPPDNVVWIIP